MSRTIAATFVAVMLSVMPTASQHHGAAGVPVKVAVGPRSSSYQSPHGFTTRAGTSLVSWYVDSGGQAKGFLLARQHGSHPFTKVAVRQKVDGSPMSIEATPQFYQHGTTIRMVTQAQVPALGQEYQGTYVWTSNDDGTSWSSPTFVYKYFGSSEIGPDSSGGLWAVSELTGVYAIHISRSLAFQPDRQALSDRITSRGWIVLTTAGPQHTLLTAFYASNGSYLHVGSAFGKQFDIKVFKRGSVSKADLAGDTKRAMLVGVHPQGYDDSAISSVYARSIAVSAAGKVTLGPEKRLSGKRESVHHSDVSVQAIQGHHGQFGVTWLNDKSQLRYRHTKATGWSTHTTSLSYVDHGYPYLFQTSATARWVLSAGLRDRSGAQVPAVIAVRTP